MVNVRNIIITAVAVILLILIIRWLLSSNTKIDGMKDAKKVTKILPESLEQSNAANYAYSAWMYVDDWNYKYGQKKTILKRDNNNQKNPHIYLDSHKNNIIVDFYVKEDSNQKSDTSNNYDEALQWCKNN